MGGGSAPAAAVEAPFSGSPVSDPNQSVEFSMDIEEPVYEFDLEALKNDFENQEQPEESMEGPSDLLQAAGDEEEAAPEEDDAGDDLDLELDLQEDDDNLVNEIMDLMNEMYQDDTEVLEEELIVDTSQQKTGYNETFGPTLQYEMDMEKAKKVAEEKEEENENLKETLKRFKLKNKQYKDAVEKLSGKLTETMLSNAKLIYSNKTLGDASLNERQKSKIVEAIAKARTPEEAKNLCEALNATVTSGSETRSPRTLSESVQRKSNLSGILPRRNKQDNESETHTFADQMKKLAGIK
jgi:hypothetical protein